MDCKIIKLMNTKIKTFSFILIGSLLLQKTPALAQSDEVVEHAEEFVVVAPSNLRNSESLMQIRKNSTSAVDGSTAEQISRQGDSNAASALRRITGVSIFDGKFVVIRGLGDRYSLARYNDFFIPPLEANKKQIALDLFPTNTLESIQVDKTTSAYLPADFGGGLVNLKTRPYLGFSGFRAQVGFLVEGAQKNYHASGNGRDLLSQDMGNRRLPGSVKSALQSGRPLLPQAPGLENGFTLEELKQFSQEMPKTYDLESGSAMSLPRLQIQASHEHRLFGKSFIHSESLNFQQTTEYYDVKQNLFDVSSGSQLAASERNNIALSNAQATLSLQHSSRLMLSNQQALTLDLLGIRQADETIQLKDQAGPGVNDFLRQSTQIEYAQRNFMLGQLRHKLKTSQVEMNTGVSLAHVQKETPDLRTYTYRRRTAADTLEFDPEVSGNARSWDLLTEGAQDIKWDFKWSSESQLFHVKGGMQLLQRTRETESYRLQFVKNYIASDVPDLTNSLNKILSDPEDWILVNQTQTTDAYNAKLLSRAVFLEAGANIGENIKLVVGQRLEGNDMSLQNLNYQTQEVLSGTDLKTQDLLPSVAAVYVPNSRSKVIVSYSQTMAFPDFRELSPVRYFDMDAGTEARGNPELKPAQIYSYDLRYEFYPHEEEIYSIGVFQKNFENPIEDTFLPIAGGLLKYPTNIRRGLLRGLEGEVRLSARKWMRELRFVHLSFNGSLLDSQIQLNPGEEGNLTNTHRPMQGQSPWLLNSEVYYQRDPKGWLLSLSYNVAGPRIYAVGTESRPDVMEQPFHQVDFSASWAPSAKSKWVGRVRNILDSRRELQMGDEVTYQVRRGPELLVSYSEVF